MNIERMETVMGKENVSEDNYCSGSIRSTIIIFIMLATLAFTFLILATTDSRYVRT